MYAKTFGCMYAETFGCMYAETLGCMYADFGCMSMKRLGAYMRMLGAKYAVVGSIVCGCWVQVYGAVGCLPDSR